MLQHHVHPPCQARRCRDGTGSAQGIGKTWRENPALWEVWEEGGLGRVLAPLHALASSWQEEGMAPHFSLRSKRGAPLLPPGLQRQHDSCQARLGRPVNEPAQRAQQLPAARCELRAGTPELCSSVGAVKGTGAISTNNPSGQGARDNGLEKGLGKLLGRRQRLRVDYLPFQTRRRAEMERVKLELLRTGSMGTVRGCSRGLISARGIPASLRGMRGALWLPSEHSQSPITHSHEHPRY